MRPRRPDALMRSLHAGNNRVPELDVMYTSPPLVSRLTKQYDRGEQHECVVDYSILHARHTPHIAARANGQRRTPGANSCRSTLLDNRHLPSSALLACVVPSSSATICSFNSAISWSCLRFNADISAANLCSLTANSAANLRSLTANSA